MSKKSLADFPISHEWKAENPEILQLYSFPTPNGVKVSIALEELGVPYEAHRVPLNQTETPPFLSLNPNNKIPAIIDPDGPNDEAFGLWESGAILIYLAEKHGALLPKDPALKYETIQWVMFQMGGIGPMFGQYGFFSVFAGKEIDDPRPRERYRLPRTGRHFSDARRQDHPLGRREQISIQVPKGLGFHLLCRKRPDR